MTGLPLPAYLCCGGAYRRSPLCGSALNIKEGHLCQRPIQSHARTVGSWQRGPVVREIKRVRVCQEGYKSLRRLYVLARVVSSPRQLCYSSWGRRRSDHPKGHLVARMLAGIGKGISLIRYPSNHAAMQSSNQSIIQTINHHAIQ